MRIETKKDAISQITRHRVQIQKYGVRRVGLFGSFVRNQNSNMSDIDVLVEFVPGKKDFDNFIHLAFYLEDILGRKVDLVTLESLSPFIGPHILCETEYVTITS